MQYNGKHDNRYCTCVSPYELCICVDKSLIYLQINIYCIFILLVHNYFLCFFILLKIQHKIHSTVFYNYDKTMKMYFKNNRLDVIYVYLYDLTAC